MIPSRERRAKAFLENPDDYRHGTKTGYWLAPCHCPKCEAYRAYYNHQRREKASEKAREKKLKAAAKRKAPTKEFCTVDEVFKPMMGKPSIIKPYCVVCGSTEGLEQHHPVKRSEGKWYVAGREMAKPTLTLCRKCHAKVHSDGGLLYFRWVEAEHKSWNEMLSVIGAGHWEFLEISREDEKAWREAHKLPNGELPVKIGYVNALKMKGWSRIR